MKKILISMLVCMMILPAAFAQTVSEKEEFAKWQEFQRVKQGKETVAEQAGRFAGVGKEIGIALKDAVQAFDQTMTVTEDHVYKFAATPAGKITIGLIAWKVAGKAVLGVVVGSVLMIALALWTVFWMRYFFMGKLVLDKKTTKSWFSSEKSYVRIKASNDLSAEAYMWWCGVFTVGSLIFFGGAMICFFGGA